MPAAPDETLLPLWEAIGRRNLQDDGVLDGREVMRDLGGLIARLSRGQDAAKKSAITEGVRRGALAEGCSESDLDSPWRPPAGAKARTVQQSRDIVGALLPLAPTLSAGQLNEALAFQAGVYAGRLKRHGIPLGESLGVFAAEAGLFTDNPWLR